MATVCNWFQINFAVKIKLLFLSLVPHHVGQFCLSEQTAGILQLYSCFHATGGKQ